MAQSPSRIKSLMTQTADRIKKLEALQRVRQRRLRTAVAKTARPAVREGLDYVSLPAAEAKRLGATFVMRYLSNNPEKNLTNPERRRLHELGIDVGVIWETSADRALAGRAAGIMDAKKARTQAIALGIPVSVPIYFAVDFDTAGHADRVGPYFRGAMAELGPRPVGGYGSYEVVKYLGTLGVAWLWQTYAWSAKGNTTQWHPKAQIRQYENGPKWDRNRTTRHPAGLWLHP